MKMQCPHCGVSGKVDDSLLGRKVKCPKCVNTFVVNAGESEPIEVGMVDIEDYGVGDGMSAADLSDDDFDISDLLRAEDDQEEFPSRKCVACGQSVHPALLMEVESKMYCAGCVPENMLASEDEDTVIGDDDFGIDTAESMLGETDGPLPDTRKTTKKKGSGTLTRLLLLFLLIALGCAAAVIYLDIKLF